MSKRQWAVLMLGQNQYIYLLLIIVREVYKQTKKQFRTLIL